MDSFWKLLWDQPIIRVLHRLFEPAPLSFPNSRWAEILVPGTTPKMHEVWTELAELRVEFKGR